jgi:PAS domain S-box-containing protein
MYLLLRNTPPACCGDSKSKATGLLLTLHRIEEILMRAANPIGEDKPLLNNEPFNHKKTNSPKNTGHSQAVFNFDPSVSIFREMEDSFLAISAVGTILDVNPSFCQLSGYSREELLNQNLSDFSNFLPLVEILQDSFRGNDFHETTITEKGGEIKNIVVSITNLYKGDGNFFCIYLNITNYEKKLSHIKRIPDRTDTLVRTASILAEQFDNKELLNIFCKEVASIFNLPAAHISLVEEAKETVFVVAKYGYKDENIDQKVIFSLEEINQILLKFGFDKVGEFSISKVNIFQNDQKLYGFGFRSRVTAQIIHNHELFGFLSIFSKQEKIAFSMEYRTLLYGLATQVSQAIVNRRLYEEVLSTRQRLSLLNQKLIEVQENEKRYLAMELHDQLGQMLSSAKIALDMASELPPNQTGEQIKWASDQIGDIITRVRRLSLDLRPSMLDDFGLLAALQWLIKDYQKQTNEKVTFLHKGLRERFSNEIEISAYRIVQEALTNIIRHAGNYKVSIKIWAENNILNIHIRDFGYGFHPSLTMAAGESVGLAGMMERVNLLQGKMKIKSVLYQGTCIIVELPIKTKD